MRVSIITAVSKKNTDFWDVRLYRMVDIVTWRLKGEIAEPAENAVARERLCKHIRC
jgi:hypothetical protein